MKIIYYIKLFFNTMNTNVHFVSAGPHHPLFMPALIGAVSVAATLLLLLLVVSYKWKQV